MSDKPGRPVPKATPETQHFWDGCNDGKIILQRCKDTGKAYFPPRPFSPYTGSRNVETFEASGKGVLWSLHHQRIARTRTSTWKRPTPSPSSSSKKACSLMTNIMECDQTPEALQLDMPLEVTLQASDRRHQPAAVQAGFLSAPRLKGRTEP